MGILKAIIPLVTALIPELLFPRKKEVVEASLRDRANRLYAKAHRAQEKANKLRAKNTTDK